MQADGLGGARREVVCGRVRPEVRVPGVQDGGAEPGVEGEVRGRRRGVAAGSEGEEVKEGEACASNEEQGYKGHEGVLKDCGGEDCEHDRLCVVGSPEASVFLGVFFHGLTYNCFHLKCHDCQNHKKLKTQALYVSLGISDILNSDK